MGQRVGRLGSVSVLHDGYALDRAATANPECLDDYVALAARFHIAATDEESDAVR